MPSRLRKIAIVGSRSVGKSSLAVRYVDNHFVESYYPTIENTFSKSTKIRNQDYDLEIVDTAGQDEYSIITSKHLIGIHGYMLVYSVSSNQSFEMVRTIREKILSQMGSEKVPIVIIANKSDLRPEQRQVETEDGKRMAAELGCPFVEVSARHDLNVAKAFELLIEEIERVQNPQAPAGNGKCILM